MKPVFQKQMASLFVIAFLFISAFFISCKKDIHEVNTTTNPQEQTLPDLQTKVSSSVSGFVTNQNNQPVQGATVKAGTVTTTTDQYGYFVIRNVQVVKLAATVTVTYTGYFNAVKTYIASEGKAAFFRIKLLQKTIAGTINAGAGGNVSLSNGTNISFPANAIKDLATGVTYSGSVNIAAQYIDPLSAALYNIMPGDLRGINTGGAITGLTSYGMLAVELTGSGGELLQIADGKKSTLTMPIPVSIASSAPSSIPLWHFDETIGLWKEDGTAIRSGNNYIGDVSHFSNWNLDLPNATVPVDFTITDNNGTPLPNVNFDIIPDASSGITGHTYGYTDSTGYVLVPVTANTSYTIQIFAGNNYSSSVAFSVANDPVSLGNIIVTGNFATISGTTTDCNDASLTNGHLYINDGFQYSMYSLPYSGQFSYTAFLPSNPTTVSIIAEDLNTQQQSHAMNYTIHNGQNTIGNIQACAMSTDAFFNYTINGRTFVCGNMANSSTGYQAATPDSVRTILYWTVMETQNGVPIPGSISNIYVNFWSYGNPTNASTQHFVFHNAIYVPGITQMAVNIDPLSYLTDNNYREIEMNITEYGAVGEFIAGNFSGTLYERINTGQILTSSPYNVNCNFRIRRTQ